SMAEQAGRNDGSWENADPVLNEKASGVIHFDHGLRGADGLETHAAEYGSGAHHDAFSNDTSFEDRGVRLDDSGSADSDIPLGDPGRWMDLGGRIDDGREILPIEASESEPIVEICEGVPWFGADRKGEAWGDGACKYGRRQDGAYRLIPAKD